MPTKYTIEYSSVITILLNCVISIQTLCAQKSFLHRRLMGSPLFCVCQGVST